MIVFRKMTHEKARERAHQRGMAALEEVLGELVTSNIDEDEAAKEMGRVYQDARDRYLIAHGFPPGGEGLDFELLAKESAMSENVQPQPEDRSCIVCGRLETDPLMLGPVGERWFVVREYAGRPMMAVPVCRPCAEEKFPAAISAAEFAPPPVGPNDPCPCGSGRTFKQCHGR